MLSALKSSVRLSCISKSSIFFFPNSLFPSISFTFSSSSKDRSKMDSKPPKSSRSPYKSSQSPYKYSQNPSKRSFFPSSSKSSEHTRSSSKHSPSSSKSFRSSSKNTLTRKSVRSKLKTYSQAPITDSSASKTGSTASKKASQIAIPTSLKSFQATTSILPDTASRKYKVNPRERVSDQPTVPFDEFTRNLAQGQPITIFSEPKKPISPEKIVEAISYLLPWDMHGKITNQKEENLKCSVAIQRLIDNNQAIALFKDFVEGLVSKDVNNLTDFVEPYFLKHIKERFADLDKYELELRVNNIKNKDIKVDLWKITNIFGVGVVTNRKKNDGASQYNVFDGLVNQIPTTHIIKKRLYGDEKALVKVQMDLTVESEVTVDIVCKKTKDVKLAGKEKGLHHMRIENDLMEIDYTDLKYSVNAEHLLNNKQMASFQYVLDKEYWKIIDFDGFMEGNELVRTRVVMTEVEDLIEKINN